MPKCHAIDCNSPSDVPTIFQYIVDLSANPANIKNVFMLHRGCDISKKFELYLSSVIDPAEKSGIVFGHAKISIDPGTMFSFLQKYYGDPKAWAAYRSYQSINMESCALPTAVNSAPVPNSRILTTSLATLADLSVFNPALLPNSNKGFVDVSIGTHPPIIAYCYLNFDVYTIPESAAIGMIRFGQSFVKVLAKLATLTTNIRWVKNNGGKEWPIQAISDFLFTACNKVDSPRLERLLGLMNQSGGRVSILGVRVSLSSRNRKQLETFLQLLI